MPHEFPMRTSKPIISGVSSSRNIFVVSSAQGGGGGGGGGIRITPPPQLFIYSQCPQFVWGFKKRDQIINMSVWDLKSSLRRVLLKPLT